MIAIDEHHAKICEKCNSVESADCTVRWYWDDKWDLHLLCQQCALNYQSSITAIAPPTDNGDERLGGP